MISIGIIGLPNVGKSTLFNALTKQKAPIANYPFTTIDANRGITTIYDRRLNELASLVEHEEIVPSTIEFFDIAGLVKGASKGEGLGNQFLSHIRNTDAILQVLRCFLDVNVPSSLGGIFPEDEIETVQTELILKDIETLEKNKKKFKHTKEEGVIERLIGHLNEGKNAQDFPEDMSFLDEFRLLTLKPCFFVANGLDRTVDGAVHLDCKLELELSEMSEDEQEEFRKELGIGNPLDEIVKKALSIFHFITFYTTEGKKIQAWNIKEGTNAQRAAGKIHSDMERGYISADVIGFEELKKIGSLHKAKEHGLIHQKGRDYIILDGDVITFKFNV